MNLDYGPEYELFRAEVRDFLDRNHDRLKSNRRLAQPYATWSRMSDESREETRRQAASFLADLR